MYTKYFKRCLDILLSMFAMPVLLIALIIFAPVIHFTDGGPVFYNAQRIGKDGKLFKMYKFRSMYVNSPDLRNPDGSTYNGDDDPRVTKIGRFMRKTSIDEIPQFINVFLGHMSLVGPRPDPVDDMEVYTPRQKKKLIVKPGITGYNQAYYRNSVLQDEKFEHDLYYAENISFLLDLKIVFKTVETVLSRKNVYNSVARDYEEDEKTGA